jgi:hypothetical protein
MVIMVTIRYCGYEGYHQYQSSPVTRVMLTRQKMFHLRTFPNFLDYLPLLRLNFPNLLSKSAFPFGCPIRITCPIHLFLLLPPQMWDSQRFAIFSFPPHPQLISMLHFPSPRLSHCAFICLVWRNSATHLFHNFQHITVCTFWTTGRGMWSSLTDSNGFLSETDGRLSAETKMVFLGLAWVENGHEVRSLLVLMLRSGWDILERPWQDSRV